MAKIPGDFRVQTTATLASIEASAGTRIWVDAAGCFFVAVPSYMAGVNAVAGVGNISWESDTDLALPDRNPIGAIFPTRARTITIFESGHGFTANVGGSANLNDTADFCLGSQAVSVVTDGAATAKTIKKTAFTAINATNLIPVVALKVDDYTHLGGVQLYLGDSNLANYWKWEMKSSSSQKWLTQGDWVIPTLSWTNGQVTGTPNKAAITDAQMRVIDDGAGTTSAHYNLIGFISNPTKYTNGVVSFSFDDGYSTQYTAAKPILDKYGFAATAFIVRDYLGGSGRLSLDQLRAMRDFSHWEIAPHATSGTVHGNRLTVLTEEQLDAEFQELRSWFSANGFQPDVFAYPGGEYNATVIKKAMQYFQCARTIFAWPETLPCADRARLRTNAYLSSSSVLGTITAAIDAAYTNKDWLHIVAHSIVDSPAQSTDVATSLFSSIVDYVAGKGIAVATIGEVIKNTP